MYGVSRANTIHDVLDAISTAVVEVLQKTDMPLQKPEFRKVFLQILLWRLKDDYRKRCIPTGTKAIGESRDKDRSGRRELPTSLDGVDVAYRASNAFSSEWCNVEELIRPCVDAKDLSFIRMRFYEGRKLNEIASIEMHKGEVADNKGIVRLHRMFGKLYIRLHECLTKRGYSIEDFFGDH